MSAGQSAPEPEQALHPPADQPLAAAPTTPQAPQPPPPPKAIIDVIYEAEDADAPIQRIREDIRDKIKKSPLRDTYNFVFLYDDASQITRYTSNRIYSAVTGGSHDPHKPLFLLLYTGGGKVEPAYLISKCCRKTPGRFVAAVPRFAKSAGTLIALGADEIHMGIISELGPIDPQIGDYPALGLGSAVEHIARLCTEHPQAVEMLAKYLASSLNLHHLGYFERVSESAVQYAERLLADKPLPAGQTPTTVAKHFVYGYKDHGFVIDREEATEILGPDIVKSDTDEYKLANEIHQYLETVNLYYNVFKNHNCKVLGHLDSGISVMKNPS